MQWIKPNFYNVLVPVEEEKEWLLYNTLSGGLEVLNEEDGQTLHDIGKWGLLLSIDDVRANPILSYLYDREYLSDITEPERRKFVQGYYKKQSRLYDKESADIGLTIGTTITCNMGCPYCFEFEKPNKSLRNDDNIKAIVAYLRDMVAKSPVKHWRRLLVTWYGGEPMINTGAIQRLTPLLLEFCEEFGIEYKGMIITNGLLLTEKNWNLLQEHKVDDLQITIDGPEETHNKKRPLKAARGENYKKILSNMAMIRPGMTITIRINVDREIASRWDEFFDDLYHYGIWPQHYQSVIFVPSWLRPYEEITDNNANDYLTNEEFFDEMQKFRMLKLQRFNAWGEKNQAPRARLSWALPTLQEDCSTWTSPYSMVIDPEGYIQKCWETIHDSKNHIQHVSEGYNPAAFESYTGYDRVSLNEICSNCQYLPVCDKLPCAYDVQKHKDNKPNCTYWKTKLPSSLKDQYILMKHHPELMTAPSASAKENTGHANR